MDAKTEAIANADVQTNNVGLPTYSELVEALLYVSKEMHAAEDESAALQCTGCLAISIGKTDALLDRIPS